MPGVPSGRGCEACRKQKKKCDEGRPACSRCTRLNIPCIGSGEKRYKFQVSHLESFIQNESAPSSQNSLQVSRPATSHPALINLRGSPASYLSNDTTLLTSAMVHSVQWTLDLRYSLTWAYGPFLQDIPRRLGTNPALDAAADAIVQVHSSFCAHGEVSLAALTKYSRGLMLLKECLNDPVKASSPDTLCIVMLLFVCQSFIGLNEQRWSGHAEGAAQIIKARSLSRPRIDEFERKILLSLRGPVLFEGLFNTNIMFTPQEWKDLVENEIDPSTIEGQILRALARVPVLSRRGREVFTGDRANYAVKEAEKNLLSESTALYNNSKVLADELSTRYRSPEFPESLSASQRQLLTAHHQRMCGLALGIMCILNCVVHAFHIAVMTGERPNDIDYTQLLIPREIINRDSLQYAREILDLAGEADRYRPLGSNYMSLCLIAGFTAISMGLDPKSGVDNNAELRNAIRAKLQDYWSDFSHSHRQHNSQSSRLAELNKMPEYFRQLTTGEIPPNWQ